MPKIDLVLLHPPSVYDFRQEAILYGPVSDLIQVETGEGGAFALPGTEP